MGFREDHHVDLPDFHARDDGVAFPCFEHARDVPVADYDGFSAVRGRLALLSILFVIVCWFGDLVCKPCSSGIVEFASVSPLV